MAQQRFRLASPKTLVENPKNIFREKFKRLNIITHIHTYISKYICYQESETTFFCRMFWWRVIEMAIGIHCV